MDCIIFATLSPDYEMPSSACVLQDRLGISGMPAFDVRNQCSGFLYSLATANAFIKSGRFERVLVVGGEVHSTGIDITTRGPRRRGDLRRRRGGGRGRGDRRPAARHPHHATCTRKGSSPRSSGSNAPRRARGRASPRKW
jgi:acetyl-CoA acetyltransferase